MSANDDLLNQLSQYLQQNLAATQAAAQQESPYLTQIGSDANKFMSELGAKNYQNGFTPSSFWTLDSLADRTKQRDALMGAAPTGDAALAGNGNQAFLNLDKQNRNDEFNADYAREFQSNVASATQNAKAAQMQLGNLEQNRKLGAASDITGLIGSAFAGQNSKPTPTWQNLVTGGIAAIPSILNAIGSGQNGDQSGDPGAGGFGTYTSSGGQVYNLPGMGPGGTPYFGSGGGGLPYSQVQTYSSGAPWNVPSQYRPTFSWR